MKLLLKCAVQTRAGLVVVKKFDAVNYGSQLKAAVKVDIVNADNQCLNCEKKEVAESWKRGAKGAETNAEGMRIEAP